MLIFFAHEVLAKAVFILSLSRLWWSLIFFRFYGTDHGRGKGTVCGNGGADKSFQDKEEKTETDDPTDMKTCMLLIAALFGLSFCYTSGKDEPAPRSGYYIFVEDYTDHTNHRFLVESKDSVDKIFDLFFASELSLGTVDHPISIYNLKHNFYIERVELIDAKNGKVRFKHLKYPAVFKRRTPRGTSVF